MATDRSVKKYYKKFLANVGYPVIINLRKQNSATAVRCYQHPTADAGALITIHNGKAASHTDIIGEFDLFYKGETCFIRIGETRAGFCPCLRCLCLVRHGAVYGTKPCTALLFSPSAAGAQAPCRCAGRSTETTQGKDGKMKQVKRLLALVLVLATLMTALPMTAMAAGSSIGSATGITTGSTYYGTLSSANGADYYRFTLSASGRVTLTATAGMVWVYYRIYDNAGNQLWSINPSWNSTTETISTSETIDLTKGTYYFIVERDGSRTGNYTFRLAFTSANESFTETNGGVNNSMRNASSISVNNTYKGQLAKNDEKDFYRFTLSASGRVTLTATAGMKWIYYRIYDNAGNQLWSINPSWNPVTEKISISETINLTKGTYYFVAERDGSSTGNYSFKLSSTAGQTKLSTPKISAIENVVRGTSGIKMNWGKVSGATKYEVYRKKHNQSSWTKIATVTGTSYTDASVRWNSGTMYDYSVVAVNGSARSNKSSTKTILRMASPAMRGLTNNASRTIRPTWSQNKAADGYQIWYQVGNNASTRKIITVYGSGTVSRNITGLTKGNRYKVFVRSFKKVNGVCYYSAWSDSRTVKVSK